MNEDQIRDFLADHLDTIEVGLTLLGKEYHLPNIAGAAGFVDILCTDLFGNIVVIEIKRSVATSREALQELEKYLALLEQRGVSPSRLRCLLLSTTWHELAVPFAHFAAEVPYDVHGFKIELHDGEPPMRIVPHEISQLERSELFLDEQVVFGFTSPAMREAAHEQLKNVLQELAIQNYAVVECDPKDPRKDGSDFYGQIVVFDVGSSEERRDAIAALGGTTDYDSRRSRKAESLEKDVLNAVARAYRTAYDELQIMYPAKFFAWQQMCIVTVAIRRGRYTDVTLFSDEFIAKSLMSGRSGNGAKYTGILTPRLEQHWKRDRRKIQEFLFGRPAWQRTVDAIMREVARRDNRAKVASDLFAPPADFIHQLVWFFQLNGDYSVFSILNIGVVARYGSPLYTGRYAWNFETHLRTTRELVAVVREVTGYEVDDLFDVVMACQQDGLLMFEERILERLGLRHAVFEFQDASLQSITEVVAMPRSSALTRINASMRDVESFLAFLDSNVDLLIDLYDNLGKIMALPKPAIE